MPMDRLPEESPTNHVSSYWASSEGQARSIVDGNGVEWEVYDESTWSIALALDWDMLPQTSNPGLLFVSDVGRLRLWPSPEAWQKMGDADLLGLLTQAKAIT